jgi:hypothetical protein
VALLKSVNVVKTVNYVNYEDYVATVGEIMEKNAE